jgi:hypothetical protein
MVGMGRAALWLKTKKLPARPCASVQAGSRKNLIGSFACCARHWTRNSWPASGLEMLEARNVPISIYSKLLNKINEKTGAPIAGRVEARPNDGQSGRAAAQKLCTALSASVLITADDDKFFGHVGYSAASTKRWRS